MSTPLEAWLEEEKEFSRDMDEGKVWRDQAIAVIEVLKEALELYAAKHWIAECDQARQALAIDPDSLLRNSNTEKL